MTTNYREILRLRSLRLNKTDIASSAQVPATRCQLHMPSKLACVNSYSQKVSDTVS